MKISVVTISFNQAHYLEACLNSVAQQDGPWEHIIVDPGSTDGSRDIIERHRRQFSHVILEPDKGPADGLNKGFAKATGDILYYLNSDDIVLPGAFASSRDFLARRTDVDVVAGHGDVIDETGRRLRRVFSDPVSRHRLAHSGGITIQPSTFMRRAAYEKVGGFNIENRSSWDGELIVDLFLSGSKFAVCNEYWSGYRVHGESITATGKAEALMRLWAARRYQKLMGKPLPEGAWLSTRFYQLGRVIRHPELILFKLRGIRVQGSRR